MKFTFNVMATKNKLQRQYRTYSILWYFEGKGTKCNSRLAPLWLKLVEYQWGAGCRAQGSVEREYTKERVQMYLAMWDFRCNAYLMCGMDKVKQSGKWKLLNSHKAEVQPSSALSNAYVTEGNKHLNIHYMHTHTHIQYTQYDTHRRSRII